MLTPTQLTTIDSHLREANLLSNEDLILELTDHYSTALSEQMEQGIPFETAMTITDDGFGNQPGLLALEKQYVRARNQASLQTALQILYTYKRLPRLAGLLSFIGVEYYLLDRFEQNAINGLSVFVIILYIAIGWPFFKRPFSNQLKYDWKNRPYWFYHRRSPGHNWISSIVLGIGLNIPFWLNTSYLIFITIGFTISFLCFAIILEITYRQNPLFKRFA